MAVDLERKKAFRQRVKEYKIITGLEKIADKYGVKNFKIRGIVTMDDDMVIFFGNNHKEETKYVIIDFNNKTIDIKKEL